MRPLALLALASLLSLACAGGIGARFDVAWRLVDERYWDHARMAVDWDAQRERYRPQALAAADDDALFDLLEAMYAEIGDDHTVFVRPSRVAEFRERYGDLPCLGYFGQSTTGAPPLKPPTPLEQAGPVGYALLADGTGYVRLEDLVATGTAAAARTAVTALLAGGADAFVLDLRGNPGGRLVTMMQVAGIFTDGFLWRVLTTWSLPIPYPAFGATLTDAPLAVLVDGDVHSAAEGLAGALQQQGRALVVGAATAGNVDAVLPFCLRDGSQAWVATGVLAPIGAPSWDQTGVVPDVESEPEMALRAALRALRMEP